MGENWHKLLQAYQRGRVAVLSYSLAEIKVAAYNFEELTDMSWAERHLWLGLAYCYEWFRANPGDKAVCDELAKNYIQFFYKNKEKEEKYDGNGL